MRVALKFHVWSWIDTRTLIPQLSRDRSFSIAALASGRTTARQSNHGRASRFFRVILAGLGWICATMSGADGTYTLASACLIVGAPRRATLPAEAPVSDQAQRHPN